MKAPDGWDKTIAEGAKTGDWQEPWKKLPEVIETATAVFEPLSAAGKWEFLPDPGPVYEGLRDIRRAYENVRKSIASLVEAAEGRFGVRYSATIDPLRAGMEELFDPGGTGRSASNQLTESLHFIAGQEPPAGTGGRPEAEVDRGTEQVVKAICYFRAKQGWTVHYNAEGWTKAVDVPDDRVHREMPNETSAMIVICLQAWGYKVDLPAISKALKGYGKEIRKRGVGPMPEDFALSLADIGQGGNSGDNPAA
jgi:hypothetical protein